MNNMIDMFLENARQAVVRGRMTMTGIIDFNPADSTTTGLTFIPNYTGNEGITVQTSTAVSGFSTGTDLPTAWD